MPEKVSDSVTEKAAEFTRGQLVCLRSNPAVRGVVINLLPGKPENRFQVFVDRELKLYYASQLQAAVVLEEKFEFLDKEKFHAYLTSLHLAYPGLSILYSLNAARIDFIPYQFRPVLKFIKSDRPRLLIADSVGVGKTIEAGLIMRELQARREVRTILIVCPRSLVAERKWETEMKRFDERFVPLDGPTLRYCLNEMNREGVWPEQYQKVIIPYSLFDEELLYGSGAEPKRKRRQGLLHLQPPPRFDLVIIDEAHHIRNPDTFNHKAVRFFCDHAEAVLFLTATPIQLGSDDLFILLNVLRPDLIIDRAGFQHLCEPNPFINRAASLVRSQEPDWQARAAAALDQAAATPWGKGMLANNPAFLQLRSRLLQDPVTPAARLEIIRDIESMHTLSGVINRTRRRDIGDFTIRRPETIRIPFTPAQQQLHDDLLHLQAEIFSRLYGDENIIFLMTTIRRQAASCLYGLVPFLQDILTRHLDKLTWEEADDSGEMPREETISQLQNQIAHILEQARSLDPEDPKLNALRRLIWEKQTLPNNKVMLFSSFRHTLNYLYHQLRQDGFRVGLVHGGIPDEERLSLRDRFAQPKESPESIDVMLFSEVGCEGLDYQFCDCLVNYDLPWNPMRIEQRIGRIDRFGQQSECIAIMNFITPGTVDADIYERCLLRIGVFNRTLGENEEILGEITKEIKSIAENYHLNEAERRMKLEKLAENKIRLLKEQEELEQRQVELFGLRLPAEQIRKDIKEASSFWLNPAALERLVTLYLQQRCGKEQNFLLGEKPLKTLRLSQEARRLLLQDFQQLPRQSTTAHREWERWLKGTDPHLAVTFVAATAKNHPEATLITPIHPLARQAAAALVVKPKPCASLRVQADDAPPGRYPFAIYQWQFQGILDDMRLKPVTPSLEVSERLEQLLIKAEDADFQTMPDVHDPIWDELDTQHYYTWTAAREQYQQRTKELANFRRQSLATSHQARVGLLRDQLRQAADEKIRRMRQSQIDAAEADYHRRLQELIDAEQRADIIAQPVAYGFLTVTGGTAHGE